MSQTEKMEFDHGTLERALAMEYTAVQVQLEQQALGEALEVELKAQKTPSCCVFCLLRCPCVRDLLEQAIPSKCNRQMERGGLAQQDCQDCTESRRLLQPDFL